MDERLQQFETKMEKTCEYLEADFMTIRAGRANPHVLDKIRVDYYGSPTPLQQVGNVTVPEPRMIQIAPWEKSLIKAIEKAIMASDIGITPSNDGNVIRLVFPEVTEERRKALVKDVKKKGEDAKVAVRNVRRDGNDFLKKLGKEDVSEDEIKELEDQLRAFGDTMTDAFAHGFEGRGMDIGDRAWDVGKAAVHAANYGIGEAAKAFRQGRRSSPYGDAKQPSDEGAADADAAGMPGWFRQIFAKPEPTPVENIRISAKKRYSNGCTLLAVGITFAVIFGLGGIGCIAASDALLPGLITETMIGDTVATAAEGMTYTFTTGASMATTVLEITGNVLTLVACGFGAMIAAGASRLSASKKLRLLADAAEGMDYRKGLPVEMLADLTHQKKAKTLKKLRRYIQKDWLAAWLDEKTEKLYLTAEDYRAAKEAAAAPAPQPKPEQPEAEAVPLNLDTARRFVQVLEKEQQLMQDPQAREELEQMAELVRKYVGKVVLRGVVGT